MQALRCRFDGDLSTQRGATTTTGDRKRSVAGYAARNDAQVEADNTGVRTPFMAAPLDEDPLDAKNMNSVS